MNRTPDLTSLDESLDWLARAGFISGSWARGTARADSDIDVYLCDSQVKRLVKMLEKQGVEWDSVFVGSVTWWPGGRQVEASFMFPRYDKGRTVDVNGTLFRT